MIRRALLIVFSFFFWAIFYLLRHLLNTNMDVITPKVNWI